MWIRSDKLPNERKDDGPLFAAILVCLSVVFAMLKPVVFPEDGKAQPADELATIFTDGASAAVQAIAFDAGLAMPATFVRAAESVRPAFLATERDPVRRGIFAYAADLRCMTEAIYYEARGENVPGRLAVADVVINRVHDPLYPKTVCDVVYQGPLDRVSEKGCQFSFTCNGAQDDVEEKRAWGQAERFAELVLMGFARDLTDDATHYHADYVSPDWASGLKRTVQIGRHIFYKRTAG